MGNTSPVWRTYRVLSLFVSILWDFQREKWAIALCGREKILARRSALLRAQATRFRRTAVQMGGILVKLGQFLSSRVDLLPPEYTAELAALQDEVPSAPLAAVIRVIESELGAPIGAVFPVFSSEVLASASLGQVHLATLPDGQPVAVKVQRPGIEKYIESDLRAIRVVLLVFGHLTGLTKTFDLETVLREFARTVREELDYLAEGKNAEKFAANFAHRSWIKVPRIHWSHTTRRVLTMEAMHGYKIKDLEGLDRAGISRRLVASRIVRSYLDQLLRHSFVHLDPHPGNILVQEDGKLIYLDFGMMAEIPPDLRTGIRHLFQGVAEKDSFQLVSALQEVGFLRPQASLGALRRHFAWLLEQFYGKTLADIRTLDFAGINDAVLQTIRSHPFQIPAKITFLGRAVSITVGLCTALDPSLDVIKIFRPYALRFISGGQKGLWGILPSRAAKIAGATLELPELAGRFFHGLERGDLDIPIDFTGIEQSLGRIETLLSHLVNLIVLGLTLGTVAFLASLSLGWWTRAVLLASFLLLLVLLAVVSGRRRKHHN